MEALIDGGRRGRMMEEVVGERIGKNISRAVSAGADSSEQRRARVKGEERAPCMSKHLLHIQLFKKSHPSV